MSINVIQYKTAAEVIKVLPGNPLFGVVKEYTGDGSYRSITTVLSE